MVFLDLKYQKLKIKYDFKSKSESWNKYINHYKTNKIYKIIYICISRGELHVLDSGDTMQAGWGRGEATLSVCIDGGKNNNFIFV